MPGRKPLNCIREVPENPWGGGGGGEGGGGGGVGGGGVDGAQSFRRCGLVENRLKEAERVRAGGCCGG